MRIRATQPKHKQVRLVVQYRVANKNKKYRVVPFNTTSVFEPCRILPNLSAKSQIRSECPHQWLLRPRASTLPARLCLDDGKGIWHESMYSTREAFHSKFNENVNLRYPNIFVIVDAMNCFPTFSTHCIWFRKVIFETNIIGRLVSRAMLVERSV